MRYSTSVQKLVKKFVDFSEPVILTNHFYFYWLYNKSARFRHSYNISSGLFIWFFLLITLPFGLYNHNLSNSFKLALFLFPSGLFWTLTSYGVDFAFHRFHISHKPAQLGLDFFSWIVKIFIMVHIQFFIREVLCEGRCIDLAEYFQLYLAYGLMFALSYLPFSLYARYKYFQGMVITREGEELFELKGEGKKSERIRLETIQYIIADDNYVDIVFLWENQVRKMVIRASMRSIEEQLKGQLQFARVHRKYIVNLRYVDKITDDKVILMRGPGAAAGIEIPVSRKYRKGVAALQEGVIRP